MHAFTMRGLPNRMVIGSGTFLEEHSEKFVACGKKEITESFSRLFAHTSELLILLHGWLLAILLIQELSKKSSRKCK